MRRAVLLLDRCARSGWWPCTIILGVAAIAQLVTHAGALRAIIRYDLTSRATVSVTLTAEEGTIKLHAGHLVASPTKPFEAQLRASEFSFRFMARWSEQLGGLGPFLSGYPTGQVVGFGFEVFGAENGYQRQRLLGASLPPWFVLGAPGFWAGWRRWKHPLGRPDPDTVPCLRCGYDLRGLPQPSPQCPECGQTSKVVPDSPPGGAKGTF